MSILDYHLERVPVGLSSSRDETLDLKGGRLRVLSANVTIAGNDYGVQLGAPVVEAYNILQRFQWLLFSSIYVESVLGEGSTFQVRLPRPPPPTSK